MVNQTQFEYGAPAGDAAMSTSADVGPAEPESVSASAMPDFSDCDSSAPGSMAAADDGLVDELAEEPLCGEPLPDDRRPDGYRDLTPRDREPIIEVPEPPPTIYDLICPPYGSDAFKARPAHYREIYNAALKAQPYLRTLTTLEEFEAEAIYMARMFIKHPELMQLSGDIMGFMTPDNSGFMESYRNPWERASNWIDPDMSDADPASVELYLERGRKKVAQYTNTLMHKMIVKRERINPDEWRAVLAISAAQKYCAQTSAKRGRGRPISTNARAEREVRRAMQGHGGQRENSGPRVRSKRRGRAEEEEQEEDEKGEEEEQ